MDESHLSRHRRHTTARRPLAGAALSAVCVALMVGGFAPPAVAGPSLIGKFVPPKIDFTATGYRASSSDTLIVHTPPTTTSDQLLVAFVEADGDAGATQSVAGITGGGLTWSRAGAEDIPGRGASEVWQAYASKTVGAATIVATLASPAGGLVTVESFTGAAPQLGFVGVATGDGGPATVADFNSSSSALMIGGGLDWSTASKPGPIAGQHLVTSFSDHPVGDWYWTQTLNGIPDHPSTLQSWLPATDAWSFIQAEIPPSG